MKPKQSLKLLSFCQNSEIFGERISRDFTGKTSTIFRSKG